MSKLEQIYDLCADYDIEIVSFGLAPNPNGFCYELSDNYDHAEQLKAAKRLDNLLASLTSQEAKQLIYETF